MNERRRAALLCSAVAAVVVVVFALAPVARAEPTVGTVGWWTDRAAAIALPPGSFEVARSGDGVSVAAVEVVQAGPVQPTTLVLQEVGGFSTLTAAVNVCVIPAGFAAASGGPIAEAPATTCAAPTAMARGVDGRWVAEITAVLQPDSTTAFAVVPAPAAPGALPFDPGFVVDFLGASVVVPPPEDGTTTTAAPTTTTTTAAPTTTVGGGAPTTTAPLFSTPPPTAIIPRPLPPPTTPPPPDPAVTPTTVAPPVDDGTSEDLQVGQFTVGPISGSGDGKPWVRLLLLIPLSAAAGYGAVFARQKLEERSASVAAAT